MATIALANALLIYTTLLYGWSLLQVALVYTGELVIITLVTQARIFAARRLRTEPIDQTGHRWRLIGQKASAALISLLLNAVLVGVVLVILLFGLDTNDLPTEALAPIGWCLAGFFGTHLVAFIDRHQSGAYEVMPSDAQVLLPTYKIWPLIVVAIAVAGANRYGADFITPFGFVSLLAGMALVDTFLHVVELDLARPGSR